MSFLLNTKIASLQVQQSLLQQRLSSPTPTRAATTVADGTVATLRLRHSANWLWMITNHYIPLVSLEYATICAEEYLVLFFIR